MNVLPASHGDKIEMPLQGLFGKRFFPPTPVCLVSAVNDAGWADIAPISQLLYLSYDGEGWPKALLIGVSSYEGGKRRVKRIYQNLLESREFVVNFPSDDMVEKVNSLSLAYPDGFDKFSANELTAIPSKKVKAPSILECKIHIECELAGQHFFGLQHDIIMGKVVCVTSDKELTECDEEKRVELMKPLYWFGISPKKGLYYSMGKIAGSRILAK